MQAVRIDRYGGAETMTMADMPVPKVGPGDVLVEVHAASINPIDWKVRGGLLKAAFELSFPHVPGRDVSGVVAATGEDVRRFSVGERVWGTAAAARWGSHAEFAAIEEHQLGHPPSRLSHAEAASLPLAALSALACLDVAGVSAGERVLVHAGAGGVGSLAIQMAQHRGAEVAATAGPGNLAYVKALGADIAIDYSAGDFAAAVSDCDAVVDLMGGEVHRRSYAVLKPGGRIAYLNAAPVDKSPPREDVTAALAHVSYHHENLGRIAALVEAGAIAPQVERTFPLAEALEAYRLSETGHARGKIVLTMK